MSNSEELRFFVEAEFVQALANIDYVVWLAKQGYFEDSAFLNFLQYLEYFKLSEYAMHLTYHRGVEVLSLLLNEKVREVLREDPLSFRRILMDQMWSSWARKTEIN
jgi:mediator of RNA polymerase II transcription subunit 31